jgi:predicted nucleic acid-binding protein
MSVIVVDASVAAKWFLTEPGSKDATALLKGSDDLIGPELLVVESAAAIVRRFRIGGLNEAQAQRLLAEAHAVFKMRSITLHANFALLPRAEEIAITLRHALQDCLYIACAEAIGGELITADAALIARSQPHFPFVKPL